MNHTSKIRRIQLNLSMNRISSLVLQRIKVKISWNCSIGYNARQPRIMISFSHNRHRKIKMKRKCQQQPRILNESHVSRFSSIPSKYLTANRCLCRKYEIIVPINQVQKKHLYTCLRISVRVTGLQPNRWKTSSLNENKCSLTVMLVEILENKSWPNLAPFTFSKWPIPTGTKYAENHKGE